MAPSVALGAAIEEILAEGAEPGTNGTAEASGSQDVADCEACADAFQRLPDATGIRTIRIQGIVTGCDVRRHPLNE